MPFKLHSCLAVIVAMSLAISWASFSSQVVAAQKNTKTKITCLKAEKKSACKSKAFKQTKSVKTNPRFTPAGPTGNVHTRRFRWWRRSSGWVRSGRWWWWLGRLRASWRKMNRASAFGPLRTSIELSGGSAIHPPQTFAS